MLQACRLRDGVVGKWHLGLGVGGPGLERRHKTRAARDRFRLLLHHARDGRSRAVRLCRKSSRRRCRSGRSDSGQLSASRSATSQPATIAPTCSRCIQPRPRPDNRQRHQPHRLHDRRQSGPLWKRRRHRRRAYAARPSIFIKQHRDKPFFLYFATHDIHVPRVPHPRFLGKTNMGPRGDAIVGVRLVARDRF